MDKPKRKRKFGFNLHIKLSSRTNIFNRKSPNKPEQLSQRQKNIGGLIAVCLMFVIITLIMRVSIIEDQRFLYEGREAAAQVIGCTPEKSKYGPYASVSYSYSVKTQIYNGSTAFDGRSCNAFPEGVHLSAIYLVTDPGRSRVIESQDSPIAQAAAYGLLIGSCFLLVLVLLRSLLRALREPSI